MSGAPLSVTARDGVALQAWRFGCGAPVLFVHEFTGDARSWDLQTGALGRHYQCITYNARGYPPSAVPDDPAAYTQAHAADDIVAVLDTLGVESAHLVGLSMGGFAALHCALRHPQRVKSLTVAGCGYGAKPDQTASYRAAMRAEADHVEAIGMPAYAAEVAEAGSSRGLKQKDAAAWALFRDQLATHSAGGTAHTLRGVLAERPSLWSLDAGLRALAIPVLLMIGDEDAPCLEPNLFLRATLPGAALCVLPRVGHIVNLEEPALFNALLLNFLTAVDRGRWADWSARISGP
jgi:pimeloyl-ACP methyl ester carboxylesterase